MEKVAPWRSPMTVYGRPDNAFADDEAPARVPPCLFHPFLSVCSPPFLSPFFLLSFLAAFSPSCLPPCLPLCVFSQQCSHISFGNHGAFLQPFPPLFPQSEPIYSFCLPLSTRVFVSSSLRCTSSPRRPPHTHTPDRHIDGNTPDEQTCGQVFVYDRERQYRDCFRVVSSLEMDRCQECVLYVWTPRSGHFGKLKISYRMTSSGIKVNYQL